MNESKPSCGWNESAPSMTTPPNDQMPEVQNETPNPNYVPPKIGNYSDDRLAEMSRCDCDNATAKWLNTIKRIRSESIPISVIEQRAKVAAEIVREIIHYKNISFVMGDSKEQEKQLTAIILSAILKGDKP